MNAQSLWEVTPYKIQVWVQLESNALIPADWNSNLPPRLAELMESTVGAQWDVAAAPIPTEVSDLVLSDSPIDPFALEDRFKELAAFDKLVVLDLQVTSASGYLLRSRELDIPTRRWGRWHLQEMGTLDEVEQAALKSTCAVFSPVLEIESVEEDQVRTVLKAGSLHVGDGTGRDWERPTFIQPGDVLECYIRKTNRDGIVGEDGVSPIKYTLLTVDKITGNHATCTSYSGFRQPFSTRRSTRLQQLAIVVRSWTPSTLVRVVDRKDDVTPLAGLEVYSRQPGGEKSTLVGRTNWRGEVVVPLIDPPVRILLFKSGSRLLGKLPVLPGSEQELLVPLRNDEGRLEAEGLLVGIQESLVDLVARREILSMRIDQRIEEGQYDEAQDLIDELRRLPSREEFSNTAQQRSQSLVTSDNSVQLKIDQLFADTRDLFRQFLDPSKVEQLQQKLRDARENGPTQPTEDSDTETAAAEISE
ncbi:MAG: hypothetical protein KDA87_23690 [Planctomycetales bacterium]|nr:hypothetical protein [Planctomycetales bacterium]